MTERRCRATVWPILGAAAMVACSGERGGVVGPRPADTAQFTLIVSNPLAAAGPGSAQREAVSPSSLLEVVYVSIPPGAVPDGVEAVIRNRATGFSVTLGLVGGALDPTPIPAGVGDMIDVAVRTLGGQIITATAVVAARRPPVVVRTDPPPKKTDVPLNVVIVVVFSEPIDPATLDTTTIRLLRGGSAVAGAVGLQPGSMVAAEFVPAAPLEPATSYVLVVTRGVSDLAGDSLEATVAVDFTTVLHGQLEFAAVSAGEWHTCALTVSGRAYCWGSNRWGQLGTGDAIGTTKPRAVVGATGFARLDAGAFHNCALAPVAYCWGWHGIPYFTSSPDTNGARALLGDPEFRALSGGGGRTCAVSEAATAFCWGWYQLSGGWTDFRQPVRIADSQAFVALSSGWTHDCGITDQGLAYCWGSGNVGQLGAGQVHQTVHVVHDTLRIDVVPVLGGRVFTSVTAGKFHTCSLDSIGAAYCWGDNSSGQLGMDLPWELCPIQWPCSPTPVAVGGEHTFTAITGGGRHTCGLALGGVAYCWGENGYGQLGDGTPTTSSAPVAVAGGHRFAALTAGDAHSCGITTNGTVYCWGLNLDGRLGDGTTQSRAVPTRVVGQR